MYRKSSLWVPPCLATVSRTTSYHMLRLCPLASGYAFQPCSRTNALADFLLSWRFPALSRRRALQDILGAVPQECHFHTRSHRILPCQSTFQHRRQECITPARKWHKLDRIRRGMPDLNEDTYVVFNTIIDHSRHGLSTLFPVLSWLA